MLVDIGLLLAGGNKDTYFQRKIIKIFSTMIQAPSILTLHIFPEKICLFYLFIYLFKLFIRMRMQ